MVERGKYPGAKNVMGGRMCAFAPKQAHPGLLERSPCGAKGYPGKADFAVQ